MPSMMVSIISRLTSCERESMTLKLRCGMGSLASARKASDIKMSKNMSDGPFF